MNQHKTARHGHHVRRDLNIVWLGLAAAIVLTACATSSPRPLQLNGVWGGVMTYAGADFAAFAIEVATTSAGSVTGYGAVATSPSPPYVFVSVSGSTDPTNISLALTDLFNDTMFMSGTLQGQVFRGTWSFPALGLGGGFRMTSEENIGLLALDSLPPASFFDLFHQPKSP